MRFLLLAFLVGCSTQPVHVPPGAWGVRLVWHESDDVHRVCREILRETGRSLSVAAGCYKWIGDELNIYTRVAHNTHHLCDAGHELFHGKAGRFHDGAGNWIVTR